MRCNHEGCNPCVASIRASPITSTGSSSRRPTPSKSLWRSSPGPPFARTALWAHRRGFACADADAWDHVIDAMDAIDEHDIHLRAELTRKARHEKEARV
jgi:hypothetical protein